MSVQPQPIPPQWLQPIAENIPTELTSRHQWVLWRGIWRDNKWTKPPFWLNPISNKAEPASHSDPLTWDHFEFVEAAWRSNAKWWAGYGYVLSADDPYCGIDFDRCRDPQTGVIES